LVVRKGTAYENYFSLASLMTNPEQAKIWSRMKTDARSLATSNAEVEQGLVSDPHQVYFGPEFQTTIRLGTIPCFIVPTSKALSQVLKSNIVKFTREDCAGRAQIRMGTRNITVKILCLVLNR
jgi:hypothetical protein